MPLYSLGMMSTTLGNFTGKEALRYFDELELRAKLEGWSEDKTLTLLKLKLEGEAYIYFKSDITLNSLTYAELKLRLIQKFTSQKLPGECQWNLSGCMQGQDEDVSSFCIRLRTIGAELLTEDLVGATKEEELGIRKINRNLILNQFKMGLRKDIMKEVGMFLLLEKNLDLEKAEELVKLHEMKNKIIQEYRSFNSQISVIESEITCQLCEKKGHIAKNCRSTGLNWGKRGQNVERICFSCGQLGHFARECRNVRAIHKTQGVRNIDNQPGRWVKECAMNDREIEPGRRKDFDIGTIHINRDVLRRINLPFEKRKKTIEMRQEVESCNQGSSNEGSWGKFKENRVNRIRSEKLSEKEKLPVKTCYKEVGTQTENHEEKRNLVMRDIGIQVENIAEFETKGFSKREGINQSNRDIEEIRVNEAIGMTEKDERKIRGKGKISKQNITSTKSWELTEPIKKVKSYRVEKFDKNTVVPQFDVGELVY
ncbi:uncharacterized protein LOC123679403 [Harmonia axyridis]|uniref:uncharacterized protein LOC123679403 n=1 Tax=Harmonia axyridis TaxID=115357 RepID=UPI001E279204|nr:uncharacterized protein LOC123679403 [Harmonia axyridis]